MSAVISVN